MAAHEVQIRHFLQLAFQPFGDLQERIIQRRARPFGLNDHRPEGERGIFVATEAVKGGETGDDGDDHKKNNQRAVAQRPGRKIEAAHGFVPIIRTF